MSIEEIRGVQSSAALSTLVERNLVTVVGRADTVGHPLLYGTTREFLNHIGLRGLNQLPKLPEIEGLLDNRADLKKFAEQLGEDISDSDFDLLAEPDSAADTDEEMSLALEEGEATAEIPTPDSNPVDEPIRE
jgi:segregation and condensation protein B